MKKRVRVLEKLSAYLVLMRFKVAIIAVFVTYVGMVISNTGLATKTAVLACLSAFSLLGLSFVLNDFFDSEKDSVNLPKRPIPSGKVSKSEALNISLMLVLAGSLSGYMVSIRALILFLTGVLLNVVYSGIIRKSNMIEFLGNLVTGILCSILFLYGWTVGGDIKPLVVPMVLTFLFITGREILLDIRDVEGDRRFGMKTFPVILGEKRALFLAASFILFVVILNPIPYFLGLYNFLYLVLVSVLTNILLLISIGLLLSGISPQKLQSVFHLTRVSFLIGAVGFLLG